MAATLTLCSDGFDISDQVFTIELSESDQIRVFVELVKHGGAGAGLIKPAVQIISGGREQIVSHRNDWQFDPLEADAP